MAAHTGGNALVSGVRAGCRRGAARRSAGGVRRAPGGRATAAGGAPSVSKDAWLAETIPTITGDGALSNGHSGARAAALEALRSLRVPTTRDEAYRFTDVSPIVQRQMSVPPGADAAVLADAVAARPMEAARGSTVVVVDGVVDANLTDLSSIPEGVYVGGAEGAPEDALARVGELSNEMGGPFATLNTATARDAVFLVVPEGVVLEQPVHVLYLSTTSTDEGTPATSPRALAVLGAGASAELVEEFATVGDGAHLTTQVTEAHLAPRATLHHRYVELQAAPSFHLKLTAVHQAEESVYEHTEVRIGGQISRQDLLIRQLGEATNTKMRHFVLTGEQQLHDLHSQLVLDFPRGEADQVHKCIVHGATGRGVFNGNVQVNRGAQQTDAGQLTRNLLLAPKATVNALPNLQIVADDVACTHGCAISDLEDEQLFYFRARGIDEDVARQALVYSFGLEVVAEIRQEELRKRCEAAVRASLGALAAAVPAGEDGA
ncbi:unnamed protein product [Pedinophyceae sp. YPF-701]|nr:unnamed protein product [Pedinophyceae sp. YPF-701]